MLISVSGPALCTSIVLNSELIIIRRKWTDGTNGHALSVEIQLVPRQRLAFILKLVLLNSFPKYQANNSGRYCNVSAWLAKLTKCPTGLKSEWSLALCLSVFLNDRSLTASVICLMDGWATAWLARPLTAWVSCLMDGWMTAWLARPLTAWVSCLLGGWMTAWLARPLIAWLSCLLDGCLIG
jgi:hypothetical protein